MSQANLNIVKLSPFLHSFLMALISQYSEKKDKECDHAYNT